MATKSMAYDNATYLVPVTWSAHCVAGANAVSISKFVAYTNMILKSATVTAFTAGTSSGAASGIIIKAITQAGTTTTALNTAALSTNVSGYATNVTLGNTALAQGEYVTFTNGTDATGVAEVAIEAVVTPGASVTS